MLRRILRFCAVGILIFTVFLSGFLGWLYFHLRSSLPLLEGDVSVASAYLKAPVAIERDNLGVPTIRASDRLDAAFALGWLHAQDRFFQMDLARRFGAGELSDLLGARALDYDTDLRLFSGRSIATAAYDTLPEEQKQLLGVYTDGVNAGISALDAAPPEYLLPGAKIRPWQPVDSLLVALSMGYDLQDERGMFDESRQMLANAMPEAVTDYLFRQRASTEAPLDENPGPQVEIPWDAWAEAIRAATAQTGESAASAGENGEPGSNAWASARTADGRAILANDMHLGLRVPNTWYRASMRLTGPHARDLDGATLPGLPLWIVGCNRHVAWGFTNSYIDTTDLIALELDPEDSTRYRGADGWEVFRERTEMITASSGEVKTVTIRETEWGPVREGVDGMLYAVVWTGAQPWAWNLNLFEMERVRDVEEAKSLAATLGIPTQNMMLADAEGGVAWTLAGAIPERDGIDGFLPLTAAEWGEGWQKRLPPELYPASGTPAQPILWSANQRMLGSDRAMRLLGDGGYDGGARAARIRDRLASGPVDESAMLSLQGDETVEVFERWRGVLRDFFREHGDGSARDESLLRLVESWDGTASVDSVAYPAVRELARRLELRAREQLLRPLGADAESLRLNDALPLADVAFACYAEKRDALAPDPASGWAAVVREEIDALPPEVGEQTWGEWNRLHLAHPLADGVPLLGRLLGFPATPLGGDYDAVRVVRHDFGASMRMVVSPGHEVDGFYHQPAGASGHFLSPYFRTGHEAWLEVAPSPLLPGEPQHLLRLLPNEE